MHNDTNKLKPCPFCNSERIKVECDDYKKEYQVFCTDCGFRTPSDSIESVARYHWNAITTTDKLNEWMKIALWLTDCQIATTINVLNKKSTSAYDKKRMISICNILVKQLKAEIFLERNINGKYNTTEHIVNELEELLKGTKIN